MITSFIKEKINPSEKNGKFPTAHHLDNEFSMARATISRSSFGSNNKSAFSRVRVTIAMSIRFSNKSVDIGAHYYKDLAKMANLLRENSSLVATLEPCAWPNPSAIPVEITKLRLRNVMNYLVDNFAISRSRFYVDKLLKPASLSTINSMSESFENSIECCGGIAIVLKYPAVVGG